MVEMFKTFFDFASEKARMVPAFWVSKEFFEDRITFSKEAFRKGYELGKLKCRD